MKHYGELKYQTYLFCDVNVFGIKLRQLLKGEDDGQPIVRQLTQGIATHVQRPQQVV